MSACYGKRPNAVMFSLVIVCWGCSPDSGGDTICDPLAPECADGLVCESVSGSGSQCVGPLVISGRVLNIADDEPIADARVQAVDAAGAAVGTSAATDSDGAYELIVPANRDADLTPLSGSYTLRAQAASFIEFPTAIRPALPLDATTAAAEDDGWIIENALTTIKLIALPGDTSDLGSIAGTIAGETNAGLLLVAENADTALTGLSDSEGAYIIFNVPAGAYSVQGYAAGVQLDAVSTSVQAGEDQTGIDLTESDRPLNTVSGSVQIVNAPGGSSTSVILAVESTFVEAAGRGTVPPGLRVGDIEGAFVIEDIPDGSYVVLAAFENDGLVRDPDQSIGGTQVVHIEVPDPDQGTMLSISEGFKVTEALAVVSPGSNGPEEVDTTTPVFVWEDDSSEDGYEIRVFDSFGDEIWSDEIASMSGAETVSHTYAGPPLEIGMFYQFRATSFRERNGPRTTISTTEDLKGVFFYLGDATATPRALRLSVGNCSCGPLRS